VLSNLSVSNFTKFHVTVDLYDICALSRNSIIVLVVGTKFLRVSVDVHDCTYRTSEQSLTLEPKILPVPDPFPGSLLNVHPHPIRTRSPELSVPERTRQVTLRAIARY
jgi:hypothetical protein